MAGRGPRGGGGGRLSSLAKSDRPVSARATVIRLSRYLLPYRRDLAVGGVWVVLSSIASAVTPALTGKIIDAATVAARTHAGVASLSAPGLALVVASIFGWLATRQQIFSLGTAGQHALFDARTDVITKIEQLDVGYFEAVESGDLMSRLINDISMVDSFLGQTFRRLLGAAVGLAMTLAAMFWYDWQLSVAMLFVVPIMIGVTRLFGVIARRVFRERQEAIGDVSATLAEELDGIKVAQAFNRTDRNRSLFTERNAANRDANVNAAVVASAFSPVLALISAIATALVAALGGYFAARQIITIGVVVAFFSYARQFFNSISQLSSLYSDTLEALAGGERVFSLLDTPVEVTDPADAAVMPRADGRVEFRGVHFAYHTGPEILHGVDLVVDPGETSWARREPARPRSSTSSRASTTPPKVRYSSTAATCEASRSPLCGRTSASCCRTRSCSPAPSPTTSATVSSRRPKARCAALPRSPGALRSSTAFPMASTRRSASAGQRCLPASDSS